MAGTSSLIGFIVLSALPLQVVECMPSFNRVASFPICSQTEPTCNSDGETVAEIVAVSEDGMTLVYGDSATESIGFVDISNPNDPKAKGFVAVGGEVTSVGMARNNYVLVCVNTSPDYENPSGELKVIDIASKAVVRSMDLGGQPDAVAISPDKNYAAVAIENERDEDLGDGSPPQMPAGFVVVMSTPTDDPNSWTKKEVSLTNLAGIEFPSDPEPEYVSINSDNIAVVTLQENNGLVLIDLPSATVTKSFNAGTLDLSHIDTIEEPMISQNSFVSKIPREPDGVTWISTSHFVTADEGDLMGGSRGFTIYDAGSEAVVYTSGNTLDHIAARLGHYPDKRSGNKGNEPENAVYGQFEDKHFLFVLSERSSLVFVYDVKDPASPKHLQSLPAGVGPEGAVVIPHRNILVVASEVDDRSSKIRSVLNIYQYGNKDHVQYPTLTSSDRYDGTPIPWGALSGLSAGLGMTDHDILYSIEDSFYKKNRIFKINTKTHPARLVQEIRMVDTNDKLASVSPSIGTEFSADDLAALINEDKTVNIDPEGVAVTSSGFWVASEGSGTVGDAKKPVKSLNFLLNIDFDGVIEDVVTLPKSLNDIQLRFGFEGVTVEGSHVVVAFQRAWGNEKNPRLGIYNIEDKSWKFVFYPLDAPTSQNGGWVGLSDITSLGEGKFLVLERDNQGGPDATIKKIYEISLGDLGNVADGSTITKTLFRDLVPDLQKPGGLTYEKVEGLAVDYNGVVWIVNDNDGVDDNSGETQLLELGKLISPQKEKTCAQAKKAYKKSGCCGQPEKAFIW